MTTEDAANEMVDHYTSEVGKDDEGWWFVECACGWRADGLPDQGIAVDSFGDHAAAIARLDRRASR